MKLNWKFVGVGGKKQKNLPWGEYGYFWNYTVYIDFTVPSLFVMALTCQTTVCFVGRVNHVLAVCLLMALKTFSL